MDDLTAFLCARLDEDERELAKDPPKGLGYANLSARIRREVAAKRAILAAHKIGSEPEIKNIEHIDRRWNTGWVEHQETGQLSYWCSICDYDRDYGHIGGPQEGCDTLRHLAAVYSDHPDYRPEWSSGGSGSAT